jgi:fatty acid desaturase
MKTEMDVLRMDERQRLAWLRANRATLFAVAVAWLLMIGWDLLHQRVPVFLIVMVPVFALVRSLFYLYYARRCASGP